LVQQDHDRFATESVPWLFIVVESKDLGLDVEQRPVFHCERIPSAR